MAEEPESTPGPGTPLENLVAAIEALSGCEGVDVRALRGKVADLQRAHISRLNEMIVELGSYKSRCSRAEETLRSLQMSAELQKKAKEGSIDKPPALDASELPGLLARCRIFLKKKKSNSSIDAADYLCAFVLAERERVWGCGHLKPIVIFCEDTDSRKLIIEIMNDEFRDVMMMVATP